MPAAAEELLCPDTLVVPWAWVFALDPVDRGVKDSTAPLVVAVVATDLPAAGFSMLLDDGLSSTLCPEERRANCFAGCTRGMDGGFAGK